MTITLTREEAQSVLDALEKVTKQMLSARDELAERGARPVTNTHHQKIWDRASEAYTDQAIPAAETLRARLSAPEPSASVEPVAYIRVSKSGDVTACAKSGDFYKLEANTPLYLHPPQREWQGLTDEEKHKTWYEMQNIMGWYSFQEIANAIEAKLKEKNV